VTEQATRATGRRSDAECRIRTRAVLVLLRRRRAADLFRGATALSTTYDASTTKQLFALRALQRGRDCIPRPLLVAWRAPRITGTPGLSDVDHLASRG